MDAKADLAFTVALEVLRLRDRRHLRCVGQKPVAEVITDAEINESPSAWRSRTCPTI